MKLLGTLLATMLLAGTAIAQELSNEACEKMLLKAEENPDPVLYDDCGFGDEVRAWNQWAPFATAHQMKRATFELCRRYPNNAYGALYCDKAVEMNFGPALLQRGEENLKSGNTKEALSFFNQAIKSGNLSQDEIQKITETLGFLYLDKNSSEYSPDSGIALLTKAAANRSAVANNALGYLSYSGEYRIKKDDK